MAGVDGLASECSKFGLGRWVESNKSPSIMTGLTTKIQIVKNAAAFNRAPMAWNCLPKDAIADVMDEWKPDPVSQLSRSSSPLDFEPDSEPASAPPSP
jgi:hypothetical protein